MRGSIATALFCSMICASVSAFFRSARYSKNGNPYSYVKKTITAIRMESRSTIVENACIVQDRAKAAAVKAGRDANSVRLVAVSKTKPIENIQELYDAGFRCFGENYFQELVEKSQALPKDISWHFIGHLQSSKASKLIREVPNLAVLETVDSTKLAGKLNNACESAGRDSLDVFVQVDTSGEATKSGVDAGAELEELLQYVSAQCPCLKVKGLMTIGAPNDPTCFDKLVVSRTQAAAVLGVAEAQLELSMGMSGDFEEAIARGATSVRVGSTIFGPRLYPNREGKGSSAAASTDAPAPSGRS